MPICTDLGFAMKVNSNNNPNKSAHILIAARAGIYWARGRFDA